MQNIDEIEHIYNKIFNVFKFMNDLRDHKILDIEHFNNCNNDELLKKLNLLIFEFIKYDEFNLINLFINNKNININIKNEYGQTPLHTACNRGKLNIVKKLIKFGANINAIDNDNNNVLSILSNNKYEIIKILLDNKFNIDTIDKNGNTLLLNAIDYKDDTLIKLLSNYNPNLHIRNKNNKSVFEFIKNEYQIILEPKLTFIKIISEIELRIKTLQLPDNHVTHKFMDIQIDKISAIHANANFAILTSSAKARLHDLNILQSCLFDIKNKSMNVIYRLGILLIDDNLYISSFMFWKKLNNDSSGIYNIFDLSYEENLNALKYECGLDLNLFNYIKLLKYENNELTCF